MIALPNNVHQKPVESLLSSILVLPFAPERAAFLGS